MNTSARNVLQGTISALIPGAVNDEVHLKLADGKEIVAAITKASTKNLDLAVGKEAYALIKATFVVLVASEEKFRFSTRNQFEGTVSAIETNSVDACVQLNVPGLPDITAVITKGSCEKMQLKVGSKVTALVKAMNVIMAVKD